MWKHTNGQILVEILIGIVILATIAIVITQISVTGFRSTKQTGTQAVMVGLMQESLEAVEAVASANWNNIYNLTKTTQEYYPKISAGAWTLTTVVADKSVTIDGVAYQRWVIIENVCRDSSDNIVACGTNDPSTQKVTAYASDTGGNTLNYVRYYTRSRNTTVLQSDWSGGSGQATNPTSGFDANWNAQYDANDGNLDTSTAGQIKLAQ